MNWALSLFALYAFFHTNKQLGYFRKTVKPGTLATGRVHWLDSYRITPVGSEIVLYLQFH